MSTTSGHRLEASHALLDVAVGISFLSGGVRAARGGRSARRNPGNSDGLTVRQSAQLNSLTFTADPVRSDHGH